MASSFTRLTLPARVESGEVFRDFLREGARVAGLTPYQMNWLDLVLEELLVNIARNAYVPGDGNTEVAYTVLSPGALLVEISDYGCPFNPLKIEPPALMEDLAKRPIGGLGVFLVTQVADAVEYRREDGRNILAFRFPRPAEGAGTT